MSLRLKLALSFALVAALATAAAGAVNYRQTRDELYSQVDSSLSTASLAAASRISSGQVNKSGTLTPPPSQGAPQTQLYVTQRLSPDGIITAPGQPKLPVEEKDLSLATSSTPGIVEFRSVKLQDDQNFRVASVSLRGGGILQLATSTEGIYQTLGTMRSRSIMIGLFAIILSALLGAALAHTITRPLSRLMRSAEQVAASGSPGSMPETKRKDEIGRLARALSRMLSSLARSQEQQERLVQDAGHELRTPLTSIKTNLALLDRLDDLEPDKRRQMLQDLESEIQEMSEIINQLVALSAIGQDEQPQQVDLDQLCRDIAGKLERREGRRVDIQGQAGQIIGRPRALGHAILNLLDNAAKFSPQGVITLWLSPNSVTVTDQGPGIPAGSEQLIFDRFHRAVDARSQPGSGLGLSIVAEVARQHGGQVSARNLPEGGAAIGFSFTG